MGPLGRGEGLKRAREKEEQLGEGTGKSERIVLGPSSAEPGRTRPSRDTNETSKGRKKVKHEGGKVQLSLTGVATRNSARDLSTFGENGEKPRYLLTRAARYGF